ncbi:SHD1 domain-containing protein [Oceaniferula marina]|nr:SHD1 domain-containing protein [Oceaniferula marina]
MKRIFLTMLSLLSCLALSPSTAARTFTNTEGKTINAELIDVAEDSVTLKLSNGKKAKVPLSSLSEADQEFAKSWQEKNKNKISESDVKLTITKEFEWIKRPKTERSERSKKKSSETETYFTCHISNYSKKTIHALEATYTIYQRVSERGEGEPVTVVKEIKKSVPLKTLEAKKEVQLDSEKVRCVNMLNKPAEGPDTSKRETITGFVIKLSSNGTTFMTRSHPENFLKKLEEEEERLEREKDRE